MSNPASNRVRGELLREWRFSQNWDVTDLARRANLSIGQIQQLETGGTSLFYSAAIRENAARKVATLLGADPDTVIRSDDVAPAPEAPSQVVHDLVVLSRQRAKAMPPNTPWRSYAAAVATGLVSLAVLATAANWLQQKWQNGGAQQFWREAAAPVPMAAATAQVAVAPAQAASEMAHASPPNALPQPAVSTVEASVVSTATVAGGATGPTPVVPSVAASVVPPTAASSTPSATSAAAVATSAAVGSAGHPLCQQASTGHVVTPVRPSKAGDMVYVVAQKIGSVCVVDAAGVRTLLSLKPQEARSVYGVAPWRVNFEQPEQAQLYFQGERLRFPGASVTTVALREASLTP